MDRKSEQSNVILYVLGIVLVLSLVAGYNIKSVKSEGIIKEKEDVLKFSEGVKSNLLEGRELQCVELYQTVTPREQMKELVETEAGITWNEKYQSQTSEGIYYEDSKNGIIVNYDEKSACPHWVYINQENQDSSKPILESDGELTGKASRILEKLQLDVADKPVVTKNDENAPTEISLVYNGSVNGIELVNGYYSVRLGAKIVFNHKGISVISVYGDEVAGEKKFEIPKDAEKKGRIALEEYVKAKDTIYDWKEYDVISSSIVYLPCRTNKKDATYLQLMPAIRFKTKVLQYDYEQKQCSYTIQYQVYNMKRNVIEFSFGEEEK